MSYDFMGNAAPNSERSEKLQQFEVKVGGKYFGGDKGYVVLIVNGKEHFLDVEVKGKKVLLSLGERRGIPLSRAELLFSQPPFDEMGRKERGKLKETILAEVYALINRGEGARSLFSARVGSYVVKLYEDGTIGAYGPDLKKRVSLREVHELKALLLAAVEKEGVADARERLREVFEEIERKMKGRAIIELEGVRISFADGVRLRRLLVNEGLYAKLWVFGRVERGDTAILGCYPIVFTSKNGKVEVALKNPLGEEEAVLTYPLQLVRNAVLTTDELADLLEEIKRINEGSSPPGWREVFNEIVELSRRHVGIEEEYRFLMALYVIYSYFSDLLPRATYLAFVGESGSGKRQARNFVDALTPSVTVTDPTEAAMARVINAIAPVMSLDETRLDEEWIRHVLNAGTEKGLYLIRCHKDDPDRVISLDPYGPKVLVLQPPDVARLYHDTRNRTVIIPMQRRRGQFEREVKREEAWPLVKRLILLLLFRWEEFLEAFRKADGVVSQYFSGHARETWLPFFAVAALVGDDVLETVSSLACKAYRERGDLDAFTTQVVNGCLRVLSLHAEEEGDGLRASQKLTDDILMETAVEREDGRVILKLSAKHIALVNGEDDRSYVSKVGILLHRGALPFVVGFSREGKKGARVYYIDLQKLKDYVESYQLELPEDVNLDSIEKKFGIKFTVTVPLARQIVDGFLKNKKESPKTVEVSDVSEVSAREGGIKSENNQVSIPSNKTGSLKTLNEKLNEKDSADTSDASDTSNGFRDSLSENSSGFALAACYLKMASLLRSSPGGLSEEELIRHAISNGCSEEVARKAIQFMKRVGKASQPREGWLVWNG